MNQPLISIIITAYNYARYLPCSIGSALAQTYPNIEVIVMDNASMDETAALLEAYRHDERVHVYRNEQNVGQQANHNRGLRNARGEYICFLSADDMLLPDFLQHSMQFLNAHTDIDVVYSAMCVMNDHGHIYKQMQTTGEPITAYHGSRNELANLLAFSNYMSFPSLLVPRWIYERFGNIREDVTATDFDLVLRWASQDVRFGYMPEALHAIRLHDGQESSDANFVSTGHDMRDFLDFLSRYLQPQFADRFNGFEYNIARALERKCERLFASGYQENGVLGPQMAAAEERLAALITYNRLTRTTPKLCIIVLPGDALASTLASLQSLVMQNHETWEAIVVQQPGVQFDSLYRAIDPRGRIRTAQLHYPGHEGRSINQALLLSSADIFTFMHAGTTQYPHDYLAKLMQAFAEPTCAFTLSGCEYVLYDSAGNSRNVAVPHDYSNLHELTAIPKYPLDTMALHRTTLDEFFYFNEQYTLWSEWDMQMRLATAFPPKYLASTIALHVHEHSRSVRDFVHDAHHSAKALYAAYPTTQPYIQQKRTDYLLQLEQMGELSTSQEAENRLRLMTGAPAPEPAPQANSVTFALSKSTFTPMVVAGA
jgi:glycosyltransferase involved in cell wall biosynthesis